MTQLFKRQHIVPMCFQVNFTTPEICQAAHRIMTILSLLGILKEDNKEKPRQKNGVEIALANREIPSPFLTKMFCGTSHASHN